MCIGSSSNQQGRARHSARAVLDLWTSGAHGVTRPTLPVAAPPPIFRAMKYRRFGRTEISMPVISCGGMRYQFKWQEVDPKDVPPNNQANLEATIHRAIELGINHIETARGYGSSEMQLGYVLPKFPRHKIIVQTKVSPKATAAEVLKTFKTSMKYL